jgi:NAD-dependent dihydropyrimidine dehydrogenase PreA subunit
VKYGVDEDTCTGDHSCIRLSGCPTLTVKDNPDPLRRDPVATVIDGCVGCGLCGENAHAAVLCPSFYRAEVIQNPAHSTVQGEARGCSHDLPERPITILIAALGGEGGGVMADWLMEAATSPAAGAGDLDPGVAQRTGATTYYLEIFPARKTELAAGNRALADPEPGQRRHHGGLRAGRSRARDGERLREPRAHHAHRLDAPHLCDGRKDADGRRPLRRRARRRGGEAARASARCSSTCASSRRKAAP